MSAGTAAGSLPGGAPGATPARALGTDAARSLRDGAGSDAPRVATVAVIGAGTMGNGIAHVFAAAGRDVHLVDAEPAALERARATIAANLRRQAEKGRLAEDAPAVLARIHPAAGLEAAAKADLAIEAIVEDAEAKRRLFSELDGVLPAHALLVSNTSSISITSLAAATARPERVAGMHFMNPVPVMPLVEVVAGLRTAPETLRAVEALCRELGKTPVTVRDAPGFVSNRVLMPMINEAAFCVAEGVADAPSVDEVMRLGMRHPMGPLELADLIGIDVCLAILEVLHRELGEDKYRPCPLLRRLVDAGRLGRKTGRGFHVYGEEGARR